jgi:uncharacterized membrane protein
MPAISPESALKSLKRSPLITPIKFVAIASIVLFCFSSLQHGLFRSSAWDLGIFDQAVYLISQGQPPISSFLGFHILGDHAAFMFYLLALLYKIYPDVHWLLAVQAIALSVGALATWLLARQAGIRETHATTLSIVYLLYPIVFNANLADFHPEVIAIPALLFAVWAARANRIGWFCFCLGMTLICRDALALNVAAMGIWLIIFEKRRIYGAIALLMGMGWFLFATQVIVPTIGGEAAKIDRFLFRYAWLGTSYTEIVRNFFLKPLLVAGKVFSWNTLGYLLLIGAPLIWAMRPFHFAPLIGALPTLAMNILSSNNGQRSLIGQYSVPVLPFFILVAIAVIATNPSWFKRKWILTWSAIGFLILAKYGLFLTDLDKLDTWSATRNAIAQIQTKGGVLTDHNIAPHLSQRSVIASIDDIRRTDQQLEAFDYILINLRHPWQNQRQTAIELLNQVQSSPRWKLTYDQTEIYRFQKTP